MLFMPVSPGVSFPSRHASDKPCCKESYLKSGVVLTDSFLAHMHYLDRKTGAYKQSGSRRDRSHATCKLHDKPKQVCSQLFNISAQNDACKDILEPFARRYLETCSGLPLGAWENLPLVNSAAMAADGLAQAAREKICK